jgi:hypothetical protein
MPDSHHLERRRYPDEVEATDMNVGIEAHLSLALREPDVCLLG